MPLRDLPTEPAAAEALLRIEALRRRRDRRRANWHPLALAGCAVGALLMQLLPGLQGSTCYLWRASAENTAARTLAGLLPLTAVVIVLLDRIPPSAHHRARGWAATFLGVLTVAAWTTLLSQGRTGCETSPAVLGTTITGALATLVAALWARRSTDAPQDLVSPSNDDQGPEELNQAELRAAFLQLQGLIPSREADRTARLAPLAGTTAGLLLLSTVLPWREMVDPVALGPGGSEAGLPRFQLWDMSYAGSWPVVIVATALVTIVTAISAVLPLHSSVLRRVRHGILAAATTATGVVTLAGLASAIMQVPPGLPDGVGYKVAPGAWLAFLLGLGLTLLGLTSSVLAVRRRAVGWSVQLVAVVLAAVVGAAAGIVAPAATSPAYEPDRAEGMPHRLLGLQRGQLVDAMGMRVAVSSSNPLTSVAWSFDGEPGSWLLGRTGSDSSTVFALRDGVALPQTTLSHGYRPPTLIGVSADKLLLLSEPSASGGHWALLAVPLNLVAADISLEHQDSSGAYYVTPGVELLTQGQGEIGLRRSADDTLVLWNAERTWRVPVADLRPGLSLDRFALDLGPGSSGNDLASAADGTVVWRTGARGLGLLRPGEASRQLTGTALEGCPLSSDLAGSGLPYQRFALDTAGNVWLSGDKSVRAAVLTPDGVLRMVPQVVDPVDGIEARPDGSVLLAVSPTGGDQILEITGGATAAAKYRPAPPPPARCDTRDPGTTGTAYEVVRLPAPPSVTLPVSATGKPGRSAESAVRGVLALDTRGRLVRMRYPLNAQGVAADGQGGLWWGVMDEGNTTETRSYTAVHLPARSQQASSVRDPQPVNPDRQHVRAAAYGDSYVSSLDAGRYGFYGPGIQAKRVAYDDRVKGEKVSLTRSGAAGLVLNGRLHSATPDGRLAGLFGGPGTAQWPIWSAVRHGVDPASWSTAGSWFGGPDGRLWGYDGSHLYRVEGAGRVTVLAGPREGVPQAADRVTVIGPALYFELGNDVVRLAAKGGPG